MRKWMLMLLALFLAVPAIVGAEEKKSFDGLYWEVKPDLGVPLFGWGYLPHHERNRDFSASYLNGGLWLGGFNNDRLLVGNVSLSLALTGEDHPPFGLGLSISPAGFQLYKPRGKMGKGDNKLYLRPTYTYLIGLNGHVRHPHVLGVQFSVAFH